VRRHGEGAIREWLANTNRLRFRIPNAKPGLYKYVIYCKDCIRGPEGALIQLPSATPRQRALLREQSEEVLHILPAGDHPAAEETGETPWLLAGLGLTALAFAAAVAVRRLRRTG